MAAARSAQLILPDGHEARNIHRVNPPGTHAIVFGDEPAGTGDPDTVEIHDLTGSPPTARLSPLSWTWRDTMLRHRMMPWVRWPDTRWLPADGAAPWALWEHRDGRFELEPADPAIWLRRVCDALSILDVPPDPAPPPRDVYDGPLCGPAS